MRAVVFALSFVLRAVGDATSQHWLLNVTPLGWIEKLQPLVGSQPIWLVPIFASVAVLFGLTIFIASRRDIGDSVFADSDSATPRLRMLNSPLAFAVRLTRASSIGWLLAITAMSYLYGSLTKSVIQSFAGDNGIHKALKNVTGSGSVTFAELFLGAIFLILMAVAMAYVANAMGKVRDDEAEGYVDNFLVQPVTRFQWLGGRVLLIAFTALVLCLFASLGIWAGIASQHVGRCHSTCCLKRELIWPAQLVLFYAWCRDFGPGTRSSLYVAGCVLCPWLVFPGFFAGKWRELQPLDPRYFFAPSDDTRASGCSELDCQFLDDSNRGRPGRRRYTHLP